jgi:ESCRT-I complex subunit TSG101
MAQYSNSNSSSGQLDSILINIAYSYRNEVKRNIEEVCRNIRTLEPRKGELIHNNGMSSQLCLLQGTIPMTYMNVVYNIPVDIFVGERFPAEPPHLYVRPTSNMMVKPGHPWVEPDGLLCTSTFFALSGHGPWQQQCTLARFVEFVGIMFGKDPPLFTRPKPRTTGTYQQVQQQQAQQQQAQQQQQQQWQAQQQQLYQQQQYMSPAQQRSNLAGPGAAPENTKPSSSSSSSSSSSGGGGGGEGKSKSGVTEDMTSPFSRDARGDLERVLTERLQVAIIEDLSLLQTELEQVWTHVGPLCVSS